MLDQPLVPRSRPSMQGRPHPERAGRHVGPAGRILVIGSICLSLWALLAAPALLRAAESSPLGLRRSAALSVLRPLTRAGAFLGLDRLGRAADHLLGRGNKPGAVGSSRGEILRPPGGPFPPIPSRVASDPGIRPAQDPLRPSPPDWHPLLPRPTKERPLAVLVVGDSVGEDLAIGMSRLLSGRDAFILRTDARQSTGLARPDYFDWAYQVGADLRSYRPGVVVAMFGANDPQGLLGGGRAIPFGAPEWKSEYRNRVGALMDQVLASGRPLVWVGQPPMADTRRSQQMRMLNGIYRSEAEARAGVTWVDSWDLFTDANGRYSAYLPNPSGRETEVRTPDGVHLTPTGDDRLATEVFDTMTTLWRRPR